MNYIIIDREEESRMLIKGHCSRLHYLKLVAEISDADFDSEDLQTLIREDVDLIFTDPQSFELDNLEPLKYACKNSQVVLCSATQDFAFDAFDLEVSDYIAKPVEFERLVRCVEAARRKILIPAKIRSEEELYIKVEGKLIRLPYSEIQYVETRGDYSFFYTERGTYPLYASLKHIAEKLNPDFFVKVHRSFIINLDHIKDIQDNSLHIGDKMIPISRSNRPHLMNKLNVM